MNIKPTPISYEKFKEIWDNTSADSFNTSPPISFPQNGTSKVLEDASYEAYKQGKVIQAPKSQYPNVR